MQGLLRENWAEVQGSLSIISYNCMCIYNYLKAKSFLIKLN